MSMAAPTAVDGIDTTITLTTRQDLGNRQIADHLGLVRGNSVRARNAGRDLTQWLRNLIGGELKAYSTLMSDTRDQALTRVLREADSEGADAVVNVRFETSKITSCGAELLAYSTAVRLE